ncbi:hypothetical protein D3C83_219350 [compost metagenome]
MQVPDRFRAGAWLATVVLAAALVSLALSQPHDITLAVMAVAGLLFVVDWLISARSKGD